MALETDGLSGFDSAPAALIVSPTLLAIAEAPIRRVGPRSLRLSLFLTGALVTVVTAGVSAMVVEEHPDLAVLLVGYVLVGWASVVVGLVAWDRRPSNRTGLLLVIEGLATMGSASGNVRSPSLVLAASVLAQAPIGGLFPLLLAFPSGRLRGWTERALVIAAYLVTVGLQVVVVLLAYDAGFDTTVRANHPLAHGIVIAQQCLGALVIVATTVVLLRRIRSTSRLGPQRRTLAVVFGYGTATILFLPFSAHVLQPVFGLSPVSLFTAQLAVFLGVPFVFAAGILLGFGRTTEIEELGAWLGTADTSRPNLRDALAHALGDPSLQLLFPDPGGPDLLTPDGRPARSPAAGSGRASVSIAGPAGPAATIVYDPALIAEPEWVRSAGRVVSLALERERLTAQLIASREQVRQSRTRLVEVADLERRRFAGNLHDLLQSRLVMAALHAGALASQSNPDDSSRSAAASIRLELDAAMTELRHLVHDVMPAVLQERGLFAAAKELADRVPVPVVVQLAGADRDLPASVAYTAYFILLEAVSNAVKHARCSTITLNLARAAGHLRLQVADDGIGGAVESGSGLRGIADRVDALDGALTLMSPRGRGTSLDILLPSGPSSGP